MHKIITALLALCTIMATSKAQLIKKQLSANVQVNRGDTINLPIPDINEKESEDIPVVTLNESDLADKSSQNVSSLLTAGQDVFNNIASYNFSPARFKIRGYDADLFSTHLNGVPMENLENGFTTSGLWGGLNDVMRYRDVSLGLRSNTFSFGVIGGSTNIDASAGKQRKQTQVGYAFSNRNYSHRLTYTHSTGVNKKGWAFSVSGSRRWADEGYVPGSYYNGWSGFIGIDKHLGNKHTLSLLIFDAPTEIGKQGASTEEVIELTGTHYYNPYWGYQNGRKRNANVGRSNQPVFIFTHYYKINNKSNVVTAFSYSFGNRSSSSLDWFNAADPRPDYYHYLPSNYKDDPGIHQQLKDQWKNDENTRQINWSEMYDANRSSIETFNGVVGHRAHYLLQEAMTNTKHLSFNMIFNKRVSKNTWFTTGVSYQSQINNYYKKILDLLGADYFVDLNQFAERDFPLDSNVNQNDLNRPNRIVRVGDRYGYDYDAHINKAEAWMQGVIKLKRIDFFIASQISNTRFWRVGKDKNGLFPTNSYGKSSVNNFNNYAVKMGLTYKINGRNYLYANGALLTRAPYFDNVFMSPRTRDTKQNKVIHEKIKTVEGGYVLNAPKLKVRVSGYYTEFDNQLDVKSFYHDEYRSFVNLAISNINKLHLGGELGFEVKVLPEVTISGAASIGRYYYNSRQHLELTVDNDATQLPSDTAYTKNYRLGGSPQEAYSLNITFRSSDYWVISLAGNYFNQMWENINPIRRTYKAVEDAAYNSADRNEILAQQQLKGQYTLDLYAGYLWKLPRMLSIHKKNPSYLVFNVGVSNLLNNKNINGGYEQLRYDFTTQSVGKFPSKYYYACGINCFISTAIRF
jgi:hypothetical protein